MWKVTIYCSAEAWKAQSTAFREIVDKYPAKLISSRKTRGEEQRIMEYELEDANDAELLMQECTTLEGFMANFEST